MQKGLEKPRRDVPSALPGLRIQSGFKRR